MTPPCPYCGEVLPHPPHTAGVSSCGRIVTQPKEQTVSESGVRKPTLDAMLDEIVHRAPDCVVLHKWRRTTRAGIEECERCGAKVDSSAGPVVGMYPNCHITPPVVADVLCLVAALRRALEGVENMDASREAIQSELDAIAAILAGGKP